ncbi:MAG TPA: tellurite resistance TerB family protein [Kofleriaceae bacterium]|nr:tellurite resistance TerB family protein [Kofleriaceae bacterium]
MVETAQHQDRSRALGSTLPAGLGTGSKKPSTDPEAARLHALLEVAYLAASADGKLADEEIQLLVANLQLWLGEELDSKFLLGLFDHLGTKLATEGAQARVDALAAQLDADSRLVAYRLACVTALCDGEVHDEEMRFLEGIVHAFEIPNAEAQAIFDSLDEALSAI